MRSAICASRKCKMQNAECRISEGFALLRLRSITLVPLALAGSYI